MDADACVPDFRAQSEGADTLEVLQVGVGKNWIGAGAGVSGGIVGEGYPVIARAGKAPQEIDFSGARALLTSGYGSSIQAVLWRTHRRLGTVPLPYGSFNLATYGGNVVTSSLLTGYVTELDASNLHRLWAVKIAPETRYVAISLWPR